MMKKDLAFTILNVRYPRSDNKHLEEYFNLYGVNRESIDYLIRQLNHLLQEVPHWNGYKLPNKLITNAEFFKQQVGIKIKEYLEVNDYSAKTMGDFLLQNHEIIKYAISRWLLVNAGIAIELFHLSEKQVESNFLRQLLEKGLKINDEVIHMHVISNKERIRLHDLGFNVPYEHWEKAYYLEALNIIDELLQSNSSSHGLFCEDSWVFDPKIHEMASDGKPYASFSFLADDKLVGERYFVGIAKPDNKYYKQYEFSLRSPRRLKLHQNGEFIPMTYGLYYPKDILHENLKQIRSI